MKMRWLGPIVGLMVLACDKKPEPAPAERTAAVVEKAQVEKAPPEIKSPEAKAPEAKIEAKAEPEAKIEAKVEPEAKIEAKAEPEAKIEAKAEPEAKIEAKAEPEAKVAPSGDAAEALVPELTVTDAAVTDAIVDRMPSTRKRAWKIGEDARLIGWFEFKNPGKGVDLELVWKKNGNVNWRFPTNVGSGKNWRTWAEKRITKKDAGDWTVEVVDANGHVYHSVAYTVE